MAEDEEILRRVLGQKLESEGFTVWLAADGREAVEVFRANREQIKVALLDIQMPELNGPEALAAVRHIDPSLHCCFMTAWAGKFRGEELAQLGASRVLMKPFTLIELVAALRALCTPGEAEPARDEGAVTS